MRALRWVGRALLGLVGLIVIAVAAIFLASNAQLNTTYTVPQESVSIPTDQAAGQTRSARSGRSPPDSTFVPPQIVATPRVRISGHVAALYRNSTISPCAARR